MEFPKQFISATEKYGDYEHPVSAPYIRKSFDLEFEPESGELLITGLGFYRVFINGTELTKCILAPYISNPDDIIYYDRYDISSCLQQGKNVIGVILGNGMQNAYGGFVWDFDKAPWRSAPMVALRMEVKSQDGDVVTVESDTTFKTHPSALLENDLRSGEVYDARRTIDDWCTAQFVDEEWEDVVSVHAPRGIPRICEASIIKTLEKRQAVSIEQYKDGYLYDFGIDAAGVCELKIKGYPGQQIHISYLECCKEGKPYKENLTFPDFNSPYVERVQNMCYTCRGGEEERYIPYFSYYGFRYAFVTGITEEQAKKDLLTYQVKGADFKEVGGFSCSDEIANLLQEMTRRSVFSNFLWIPTDCPHREKNGWTGDAALSAEHILMNLSAEDSLREWIRNVEVAQFSDGSFPGIVPTGGWGRGCGPAWDQVIVEIPYCLYKYRGDLETAREAAPYIFRYLFYLSGSRNEKGLLDEGLGDWCETGKSGGGQKAPEEVTGTAIGIHLLSEAMVLFERLHKEAEYEYARILRDELRTSFRKYLIHFPTMTVAGTCQTSQAIAIQYGIFEPAECTVAFERLLQMIHMNEEHMDGGALGLRVLFQVLADYGQADLAYQMITRKDYPSYGHWIERGATALWEDFLPENTEIHSQNHHFFGDISRWFIQCIAGIVPNPYLDGIDTMRVSPNFIDTLDFAKGFYESADGRIDVCWERVEKRIQLIVQITGEFKGKICLPEGWKFVDGFREKELTAGKWWIVQ